MSILVGFMVGVWVVFGVLVIPVFRASITVVTTEPPKAHIHHFFLAGNNCFIGNTCGELSVWTGLLVGASHRDEDSPVGIHFSCRYKKGCKFRFSGWRHNELDDLGN
jgi:hypothetical protein